MRGLSFTYNQFKNLYYYFVQEDLKNIENEVIEEMEASVTLENKDE